MSDVTIKPWMKQYLGTAGSEKMEALMKQENVDENYFTQQGITVEGEIDDGEYKQLALKSSGMDINDDVLVDEDKNELYIERDTWDDSVIDNYYDIESLTSDAVSQDMLRGLIKKEIIIKNGLGDNVSNSTTIAGGKLYLPSLTEVMGDETMVENRATTVLTQSSNSNSSQGNQNPDANSGENPNSQQILTDLRTAYENDKNLDFAKVLNESGILDTTAEFKSDEAGLQAMYYAFGKDWRAVATAVKYNSLTNSENKINYEEKLNTALDNYVNNKDGYTKENLEKAARLYYGDDIPSKFKTALGLTSQDDIENSLENGNVGNIGGEDNGSSGGNVDNENNDNNTTNPPTTTQITDEKLESIISDIEKNGTAEIGTLDAEFLAIKEIYPDSWKDVIREAAQNYTDSETGEINFKNGEMLKTALTEWSKDTTGKFDDSAMINACKKYYGQESLWDNASKEHVLFLADFMTSVTKYRNGEIDSDKLQSEFDNLTKTLDNFKDLEKGSFMSGIKALREAYGDRWSEVMYSTVYTNDDLSKINFGQKLETWAENNPTDKEKIIEVCNLYFKESDYPASIKNLLKSGDDPKESTMSQEEVSKKVQDIYDATNGWGTDEDKLSEVIMNSSKAELRDIVTAFGGAEKLIGLVEDETSGQYQKILVRAIETAVADVNTNKNTDRAAMANELYNAVDGWGTDEDSVYSILIDSDDDAIIEMAKYIYNNQSSFGNCTLEEMIDGDFSGDDHDALMKKLQRLGLTDEALRKAKAEAEE